jgi:hypothetical protein
MPILVKPDFADTAFAFFDQTAMPTGITLERSCFEVLSEFGRTFNGHRVENAGERS